MGLNKYLLAILVSVAPMNYAMPHNQVVRSVESNSVVKGSLGGCVYTMWQSIKNECMDSTTSMRNSMKMDEYIAYRAPTPKMAEIMVNFDFDSYMLDEASKMKIGGIRPLKGKDVKSIKITGYTDMIGPKTYNQMLADKRAHSVGDHIVEHDYADPNIIEYHAMGENKSITNCDGMKGKKLISCLAPDRRVEIEINYYY